MFQEVKIKQDEVGGILETESKRANIQYSAQKSCKEDINGVYYQLRNMLNRTPTIESEWNYVLRKEF